MRYLISLFLLTAWITNATATDIASIHDSPRVAIIIDDLGDRLRDGRRVIALPGQLTIGVLPYTPYARKIAVMASENNKEVLLHLPMEANQEHYLGKAGLHSAMTQDDFFSSLKNSLAYIKSIRGVSNHMGSRLTRDRKMMSWLMQAIHQHGDLYFVDSRTVSNSYARKAAQQMGLAHAERDVFLDHDRSTAGIQKQWKRFLKHASRRGSAIAIAHPYPETLSFLGKVLPQLAESDIELVSVSELIRWRQNRGKLAWQNQTSSSP
jgi:polysaccharide deacetylase 2 family uncharacterized protein YibQ